MTTINTEQLLTALKLCRGAVDASSVFPIFSHFCFCDSYVYAYNDLWAVLASVDTGLNVGIRADVLLGILPTLAKDMELKDSDKVVKLVSGKTKLELATKPKEDLLFEIPEVDSWPIAVKLTGAFIAGLTRCVQTVGNDGQHREFTGVAFVAEKGNLTLYSSDDTRISKFEAGKVKGAGSCLIPARGCSQFIDVWNGLKEAGGEPEATLLFNEEWSFMDAGGVLVYCKLMPETAPDYQKIIKRITPQSAAWSEVPAGLVEALTRAEVLVAKDLGAGLCLALEDEVLDVRLQEGNGVRYGKFEDQLPMPGTPGSVNLTVEVVRLNQSLQGAEGIMFNVRCLGLQTGDYTCWISPFENQASE